MVDRRLGKLPARHDPRTYRLGAPLAAALPAVPAAIDWTAHTEYQMWKNDRFGDCAHAACAAAIATWTRSAQAQIELTDTEVLDNYAAVTGFDPATGANDNGTVLLDLLHYWTRTGLNRPGQTRDFLTAYGAIQPTDTDGIKRSVAFLGGALAGVIVPQGFMNLPLGGDWDWDAITDHTPVGGHAIWIGGYSQFGLFFSTWGARTFMPWATFTLIADEAYGLASHQNWLGISGHSPDGETSDRLLAELVAS